LESDDNIPLNYRPRSLNTDYRKMNERACQACASSHVRLRRFYAAAEDSSFVHR
jgi:hypothetical protein